MSLIEKLRNERKVEADFRDQEQSLIDQYVASRDRRNAIIADLDIAIAALSPEGGEKGEAKTGIGTGLDEQSTQTETPNRPDKSAADETVDLAPTPAGGAEPNPHILPPGFMAWSSDPDHPTNPRPADTDTVICWMGNEDFVGPIPAKDFDWHHASDPILGYQLVTPAPHPSPETDKLAEFLKLEGAVKWEGGEACPMAFGAEADVLWDSGRSDRIIVDSYWLDGVMWQHHGEGDDILAYRIVETPADQVRTTDGDASSGDARIEPPISTLQASSGEGETNWEAAQRDLKPEDALTQADRDHLLTFCGLFPENCVEELTDLTLTLLAGLKLIKSEFDCTPTLAGYEAARRIFDGVANRPLNPQPPTEEIKAWAQDVMARHRDAETPTEPAAYSPVNNADEPVTKPEADFFAQAILPVQSGIEFSVDGGPKQATGAAKLFGGLGIFGKPKALVGEGA